MAEKIKILENFVNNELPKATEILSEQLSLNLKEIEIEDALCDVLECKEHSDLLSHNLTSNKIVELLLHYQFEIIIEKEQIILESSILPAGFPTILNEELIKHKGERWFIYLTDKDSFPSNPHAHNSLYKLHLGNGELYDKRKLVGNIRKKELNLLINKIKNNVIADAVKKLKIE